MMVQFGLLCKTTTLLFVLHVLVSVSHGNLTTTETSIAGSIPTNNQDLVDEKTRLGSTPPSCRHKCNECNPCKAVQVPTLPMHDRIRRGFEPSVPLSLPDDGKMYSNYKPMGWKCKCGSHLFNP
ncbi:hypothetical protein AMTRI_Chr04g245360 [Amborella trichopoda]